jgi:beta-N-acetylhexosaminidase
MAGFPGLEPPSELLAAAARGEIGGFILFRRNLGSIAEVAELNRRLSAACPRELPPFIAVDQEGGRVQRLGAPVVRLPPMRQLGQIDDVALTERAARVLGGQLAALGFNIDFAPVLDVDSNPDSPVIGDRSFGADPALCARHGIAFARGLEHAGLAACGKHYPGHGDTALDSHLALPRITHARERLQQIELAPFVAAKGALTSMMTAHIVLDAWDTERPATLSRRAIQEELRERIGFAGVIFSDDLEMKAIADNYGVAEAACEAIAAGCDMVLVCSDVGLWQATHEALVHRAEREPRFAGRLRESALRSHPPRMKRPPQPRSAETVLGALIALDPAATEDAIAKAVQERHVRAKV